MERYFLLLILMSLAELLDGELILDVHPNVIDVRETPNVMVRCSLDLLRPKTDVVYSVMIKRRGLTSAVLFKDGSYDLIDKHVTMKRSVIARSIALFEVNLHNITCVDRGEISCRMAVRRSHRNLQIGPATSTLEVIGEPRGPVLNIDPQRKVYIEGQNVHVTCSTLQKTTTAVWTWTFGNQSLVNKFDTCVHSEDDCLYKCSSTIPYSVSMDDKESVFVCVTGGMSASGAIDVTDANTSNGLAVAFQAWIYDNIKTSSNDSSEQQTTFFIAAASVIAIIVIIIVIVLMCSLGKLKSWKDTGDISKKNDMGISSKPLICNVTGSGANKSSHKTFQSTDVEENATLV